MTVSTDKKDTLYKHGLIIALCLPVAIACIDVMALSVALNNIMHDFSVSLGKTQWLLSGYTIGTAVFLITIGKLADKYGRRKLLIIGVIGFAFASLVAALSDSINLLIIARFIQGVATSVMMTTVISIITHNFSLEERGPIIGKWGFALGTGLAIGPFVGGILISLFGWRAIFSINIPICILALYLIFYFVPESKDEKNELKISWFETILLTVVLLTFVTVLSEGNDLGWTSNITKVLIITLLISSVAFFSIGWNKKNPLIDFALFRVANFTGATVCGFASYLCMYAWLFIFNIYLQNTYGMTPLKAGFICSSFSIAFAFSATLAGKIINQTGSKILMQFGFILTAIAFIWMSTVNTNTHLWQLASMFFLLGGSITIINAPSMTAAIENVSTDKAGIASGIIFTIRWVGGSIGIAGITLIFKSIGLSISCLTLAILAIGGFLCATTLIKNSIKIKSLDTVGT